MNFFNKLASKLEEFDKQAADAATNQKVQVLTADHPDSDFLDPSVLQSAETDIDTLRNANQKSQIQIASLEDQMRKLSKKNAKYESEISNLRNQNLQLSEEKQQLESLSQSLQNDIKELKIRASNAEASAQSEKNASESQVSKLNEQITALSNQLYSLQHDLQIQTTENSRLTQECETKTNEISSLEGELNRFRQQAQEALSQSPSEGISAQLAVLESEKVRLKERLTRAQQRIAQEEAAKKEMELVASSELSDAKNRISELEAELFKAQTKIEASSRELFNLKSRQQIERDAAATRAKQEIEAERIEHKNAMIKLRQQLLAERNDNTGIDYVDALKQIDVLKSEKAALLLMLEQMKNDNKESNRTINTNKGRWVPLSSIVGKNKSKHANVVFNLLINVENRFRPVRYFLEQNPLARVILVLWFIIITLLWLF